MTEAETQLIEFVFNEFNATAAWPQASFVELQLEDVLEAEGGIMAVVGRLGRDIVLCGVPSQQGAQCKLRLRGVARCTGGQ